MKRSFIIIFILLLTVSVAGCGTDSLEEYKKAAEKTGNVKKGQTSGEFYVETEFDTQDMTEEQIKELNYFKDMEGSFSAKFDDDLQKAVFRNYINFGGFGFDFDLFMNGGEIFMKLPVVGKYMKIDEKMQTSVNMDEDSGGQQKILTEESRKLLVEKWLGLMKKEDVFKGKDIVVTTQDGEVKTTEYTIVLNDEQIKALIDEGADIVLKDQNFKKFFDGYIKDNVKSFSVITPDELLRDIKESLNNYEIENFSYKAYVDIDRFIVNEMLDISIKVSSNVNEYLTGLNYSLDIKNWDINQEQTFDFPVLTEENTLDTDSMEENMPDMMEDYFNNED